MGMETDSPGFNVFLLSPTYRLTQSGVLRLVALQYDRTRPAIDHLGVEELHLALRVHARILVSGGQGQIWQFSPQPATIMHNRLGLTQRRSSFQKLRADCFSTQQRRATGWNWRCSSFHKDWLLPRASPHCIPWTVPH